MLVIAALLCRLRQPARRLFNGARLRWKLVTTPAADAADVWSRVRLTA